MSALIIPLLFYITNNFKMLILVLGAALIHEVAHIIFIKICGNTIEQIEVMAFGINIIKKGYLGYKQDIIIALAGPLVNLLLFFASYYIWYNYFPIQELSTFCGINILLFLINILPVLPLDGGRALYSYLLLKYEITFAQNLFFWLSFFVSIALFILGCVIFIHTRYNLSLIIISLFLIFNITQYNNLYNC
jgi:stage IV sporulation protein FB